MSLPDVSALQEEKSVAPDILEEFEVRTLTVVEAVFVVFHETVPHAAPASANFVSNMLEVRLEDVMVLVCSEPNVLNVFAIDLYWARIQEAERAVVVEYRISSCVPLKYQESSPCPNDNG